MPLIPLTVCLKDLGLIEEMMDESDTRGELTRTTHDRFKEAREHYRPAAGEMSVCRPIEDDAGIDLCVAGDWVAQCDEQPPTG